MADYNGILGALMGVPQQAQGLLGALVDRLGIPSGETKNAQGEVVYPTNALERLMQGSDQSAQTMAAAFMGPGAKGAPGNVVNFNSARMGALRQNNIRDTFQNTGGAIIQELPNGSMIGRLPSNDPRTSHVLLSPQGSPLLYGSSPADLIRRGFD